MLIDEGVLFNTKTAAYKQTKYKLNDLHIHNQLIEAAGILGLRVMDHIIVARRGHYSSREAWLCG